MAVEARAVKELRDKTGAGMMDCKRALEEAGGDMEEALKLLRTKGIAAAEKKASRVTNEGLVHSYVHPGGKIGVLIEVNCETDFVARNEEFESFVHDLALHVAASNPLWVGRDDVPEEHARKERDIYMAQAQELGKPDHVMDKIVEGRLDKWYQEVALLEQPFVKDPDKTVEELRKELVAKVGENVEIRRFVRFELGEEISG